MLYGERAQSELTLLLLHGSRVARMQRVELIQNRMANNCQKNGHSLAGVELVPRNNKKSILRRILYICSAIPTQPFELACVSERCAVQLGVTLEAGKAYLAEPGLSVLTRSYDGLYSHHGPSSGD